MWSETNIEAATAQYGGSQQRTPEHTKRRIRKLFTDGTTREQLQERFSLPEGTINRIIRSPDEKLKGKAGRCPTCGALVWLPCIACITLESPSTPPRTPADDCNLELHGPELKRYQEIKAQKDAAARREQRLLDIEKEYNDQYPNLVVSE